MTRNRTSRVWESVSKSLRSFRRGEKTSEEYPVSFVNNSWLTSGTTNLYRPSASLVNNQAQLQNCLDIYKPKGRCTSVVSVVLLVIGVACPISRFYDRSDRQPTGLLAFIHSGDNYVI